MSTFFLDPDYFYVLFIICVLSFIMNITNMVFSYQMIKRQNPMYIVVFNISLCESVFAVAMSILSINRATTSSTNPNTTIEFRIMRFIVLITFVGGNHNSGAHAITCPNRFQHIGGTHKSVSCFQHGPDSSTLASTPCSLPVRH